LQVRKKIRDFLEASSPVQFSLSYWLTDWLTGWTSIRWCHSRKMAWNEFTLMLCNPNFDG
jgi:hypothetical protein